MSKELIRAKTITIDTGEEKIVYDADTIKSVFKSNPDTRGRLHLGTQNKVVVIELNVK
ncbi:MAG: hypothetical protein PHH48_06535 [Eubacteriales bacterium]|nr:hypothetical protein [Eubacteriales bacterium]